MARVLTETLTIRPIGRDDAGSVERLYRQSAAHLRALGDRTDFRFDAAAFLRDGFGASPAFSGLVAVREDVAVGHLLYTFGYDTDAATRFLFVTDLAVDEQVRGQGIGRAVMARAATVCRDAGGGFLFWAVYSRNELALRFYRGLGAEAVSGGEFMTLAV